MNITIYAALIYLFLVNNTEAASAAINSSLADQSTGGSDATGSASGATTIVTASANPGSVSSSSGNDRERNRYHP